MNTSSHHPGAVPVSSPNSAWVCVFPVLSGTMGVIIGIVIANFLGWF